MRTGIRVFAFGLSMVLGTFAGAQDEPAGVAPAEVSVSVEMGLEAWARIYDVASHPRCANCHVGSSDRPMWSGPSYGKARVHGMNIRAGDSRMGVETLACATCHRGTQIDAPHSPPAVDAAWRLAPPSAHWFGQSSETICAQLRDPARNGGMNAQDIAGHLGHDVVLRWAWSPGGGREPAPYSLEAHIEDVLAWGAAGQPCPQD